MATVCSTYSFKVALPTPDCVDIGALGITMGRLCAVDDEGAIANGHLVVDFLVDSLEV